MTDFYTADILSWSEHQATLLRRRAAGDPVQDADLDLPNIATEIHAAGQAQVDAVETSLYQALLHMLKAEAWPLSDAVPHWQSEARSFRVQALRRYRPSMALRISVTGLYADALYAMPETVDGQAPLPLPATCPVTLDELVACD